MSLTVSIDLIDRDVAILLGDLVDPKKRSQALAEFAREELAKAQTVNAQAIGAVPPHETFVDGRKGAPVEAVRPDGTIVFEFELLTEMLEWIGEQLVKASPVLTGRYSRSHVLEVDGAEIPMPGPIPAGSKYIFVNRQPYASKIEPQLTVKRYRATRGDRRKFQRVARTAAGQSPQAPEGVYQAVAAIAKARFGNIAKVQYIRNYFDHETGVSHPAIRILT